MFTSPTGKTGPTHVVETSGDAWKTEEAADDWFIAEASYLPRLPQHLQVTSLEHWLDLCA